MSSFMEKSSKTKLDFVRMRDSYKLKKTNEFTYIKPGTILLNGPDIYDFYKFSDIAFKFKDWDYKNKEFGKDFVKLIYKMVYNKNVPAQENNKKILEIYKNYNPSDFITYSLDSFYKYMYAIEIPENLNKSQNFVRFREKCVKEYATKGTLIKKIKSISEFIYENISYNEYWVEDTKNEGRIVNIDEVIRNKQGVCFEFAILNFLIIKEDELLKNINIKLCAGEKFGGKSLKRNEDIEELKQFRRIDTSKPAEETKNETERIKKLQRTGMEEEIYMEEDVANNLHMWVEFELNKNERYIIETTMGTIIPKPLTEIEPLIGTHNYVKDKNIVIPFFIKR